MNNFKIFIIFLVGLHVLSKETIANNTYFNLSESNIKIQTDFVGKEIIIFGLIEEGTEQIITIKGPLKNSKIQKKERVFGFWFNTKQITYKNIPSTFFIASSSNVDDLLPLATIIKEDLSLNYILENKISKRNFISGDKDKLWKENFIRLKKNNKLFNNYKINNINNKLFQTRVFFPPNSIPGEYKVNVYQIKNNLILGKDEKVIKIEKSGIGSQIYKIAHNNSIAYGLFVILFAIISGFIAATIFRRV